MKCHSRTFVSNVLRLCTKDEMQGAEDEVEGSVLTYVTETEFRKQRSRSPSCNSLYIYDPDRASLLPEALYDERRPIGVEGVKKGCAYPGSSGLRPSDTRAIYANRQTFWVEILCGLILLSYFEVVVGII